MSRERLMSDATSGVGDPDSAWSDTWLSYLLKGYVTIPPEHDRLVGVLQLSSQRVNTGDVFVALPGMTADGRDYIDDAVSNDASVVLYEKSGCRKIDELIDNTRLIGIENLKQKLGIIASRYYRYPSRSLNVIGVTGTNGKTTTAYLVAQALQLCGQRCGYAGTIGSGFVGDLQKSELTTADSILLQSQLAGFVNEGAAALAIEVSSHGLDQGRVNGVDFTTAVFTNLSQDHLDYHQSMDKYAATKGRLFEFDGLQNAVINIDDPYGLTLVRLCTDGPGNLKCITFGFKSGDLKPRNLEITDSGISFSVTVDRQSIAIRSGLLAKVNVMNLLAAIGVLVSSGISAKQIEQVVSMLNAPPGRMEVFRNLDSQPTVVVDYAHTPDALELVLSSLKVFCRGRLAVVFGCGGDRDQSKRALMGKIAESMADTVIVTDDNPRTESPEQITRQILSGMTNPVRVIHDRRQAVMEAIVHAASDDIILVAGKGHEDTQLIAGEQHPLSDREFIPELLRLLS